MLVHFMAMESALVDESIVPKNHDVGKDVGLSDRILELIMDNPEISMSSIAKMMNISSRTVEREIKKLRETGRIERIGGRRFGRWEIIE